MAPRKTGALPNDDVPKDVSPKDDASKDDAPKEHPLTQGNRDLSKFTDWLLKQGDKMSQTLINSFTPIRSNLTSKKPLFDQLVEIGRQANSQMKIQRLKHEKNERETDPEVARTQMLLTVKRILALLNSYAERMMELLPGKAEDTLEAFRDMRDQFDKLPEDFGKLPKCFFL